MLNLLVVDLKTVPNKISRLNKLLLNGGFGGG